MLKLEAIIISFSVVILEHDQEGLTIPMKTTGRASANHTLDPETGAIRGDPTIRKIDVCFPGKTVEEDWRFSKLHQHHQPVC